MPLFLHCMPLVSAGQKWIDSSSGMDNLETQPMDETQMMGHNCETQPMDETQMMDESFSSKFQPCALSKAQTSFKDECVPGIVGEHNGSMTFDEEPLGKYPLCSPFDSDQYMINSDGYALMAPLSPPQELEVDANDGLQDPLSPPQESEGVASLESPLSPSLEPEGDIMNDEEGLVPLDEADLCPPCSDVKAVPVEHPPLEEVAQLYNIVFCLTCMQGYGTFCLTCMEGFEI